MLSFFPWYTAPEPKTIGRFQLVPYRPGSGTVANGAAVDAVLAAYTERGDRPVESVTLVRLDGRDVTSPLSADDRAALFQFAEVVAFAALARRGFFGFGFGYVNRDNFRLIIQSIPEGGDGSVSTRARRRDGWCMTGYGPGDFRSMRPPHVSQGDNPPIDEAVAGGLLAALASEKAQPYEEAIFSFNAANTDSDQTPEQHEVVSTVGAFQQLLEASGTGEDIAEKLVLLLGPFFAPDTGRRTLVALQRLHLDLPRKVGPFGCVPYMWMRDFYHVRNPFGHGRRRQDKASFWTPMAHLLLGAYLLPLAMLVRLQKDGFYALSKSDRKRLFTFPFLARLRNPLARKRNPAAPKRYLWDRAMNAAREARMRAETSEALKNLKFDPTDFEHRLFEYGPPKPEGDEPKS